jgi:hypothetical protein
MVPPDRPDARRSGGGAAVTGALGVWRALRRGAGRDSHLPAVLALVAFAVNTAALLRLFRRTACRFSSSS